MTPFGNKAVAETFSREAFIARKMIQRVCNPQPIVLHRSLTNLTAKDFGYCGDHLSDYGIMYLSGNGGQLVNMDIDCDGALGDGDGSCDSSDDTQPQTRFQDTVAGYHKGVDDLNAYVHSYIVLGNEGKSNGYISFDPQSYGVEPLSIVGVVCGDKMVCIQFKSLWNIN